MIRSLRDKTDMEGDAMMQGWFVVSPEQGAKLIRLTMGGFFASATIQQLRAELIRAIASLSCPPNTHVTLCDIRQMDIQSQERVDEFSRLVGSEEIRSRKLAFVTAKSLARLQAKRLTSREGVAFFSDIDAALDWLTG